MVHILSGGIWLNEKEIHKMRRSNRDTERNRFFLAIANVAGDIIHFNSAESPIHNVSPSIELLLGYSAGKLSGLSVLDLIHPKDRIIVLNAMASTVESSTLPVREIRLVKKDGTSVKAQMSTFFFKVDGQGRVGAVLREVSEKKSGKDQPVSHIIPICMYCNKIQSQFGTWMNPVNYLLSYTGADLSHGICPECVQTQFPDFRLKNSSDDEGK